MKVGDAFSGDYLKQEDLQGKAFKLTIAGYEMEKFDDGDKPGIRFEETTKVFVCNKTNANRIVDALGTDEMDEWLGKKIELYNDASVEFGGKRVGGVRVRVPQATPPAVADENEPPPF